MNPLIQRKTTILPLLSAFALVCFVLAPTAQAISPSPDGFYPGGNTAEGENALFSLTSGEFNTAIGYFALTSNKTGSDNTAIGSQALVLTTRGIGNTAIGSGALASNDGGSFNTATGSQALVSNIDGPGNTANGRLALFSNTRGGYNTATGFHALLNNKIGVFNTAVGFQALANNTGHSNIALGNNAGVLLTTGNNNIYIGSEGRVMDTGTIIIGRRVAQVRTFIAGIRGATTGKANAIPVVIDLDGQLGTVSSSCRFKKEIKPMDQTSEAILALKPVTFHYKNDSTNTRQFGLIAEDVAKVNPDLVVRDADGKVYTVRYEAVNAMLLNEFLKEHRKNEEQEKTIAELKSGMTALIATVKEQAAQIQKVSAELEASKPAPRVVNNP
jgi:Chaperone of endosialidase